MFVWGKKAEKAASYQELYFQEWPHQHHKRQSVDLGSVLLKDGDEVKTVDEIIGHVIDMADGDPDLIWEVATELKEIVRIMERSIA